MQSDSLGFPWSHGVTKGAHDAKIVHVGATVAPSPGLFFAAMVPFKRELWCFHMTRREVSTPPRRGYRTLALGVMTVANQGGGVGHHNEIPFSQGGSAPSYLLAKNPSGPNQQI